jgi:hypothetical protein
MKHQLVRAMAVASTVSLGACTTLQTIMPVAGLQSSAHEEVTQSVHVGDRIVVTSREGQTTKITVTEVSSVEVSGLAADSNAVRKLPIADISKIEKETINGWKTAGLVVGLAAVTIGLVYAWALHHFLKFEDSQG